MSKDKLQVEGAPRRWKLSDYVMLGLAIGSAYVSRSENINAFAATVLGLFAESVGTALIVDLFYKRREFKSAELKARESRIASGTEIIQREGEQIIFFGGDGSFLVDHLAINSKQVLPVYNNLEAAQVLFRSIIDKREPVFLNLGISSGITVIDTPNLDLIDFNSSNLIETSNGKPAAITVSVGNTFPVEYAFPVEGITDAQAMILNSRLTEESQGDMVDPTSLVHIRVDQMYAHPGNRAVGDVLTTRRSDWEAAYKRKIEMGGVCLLDPWAVVMRSLCETAVTLPGSSVDAEIGYVIESDSLPSTLPLANDFDTMYLGKNHHYDTLVAVRNFFRDKNEKKRVMITLVMESTDEAVLAKVIQRQSSLPTDFEEDPSNLIRQDEIYVFQTEKSAEIARQLGALNVVCVAECVGDMISEIISKVRNGDQISDIQKWVDDLHKHQKIMRRIEKKRISPAMDRLDILRDLDDARSSGWWESLYDKEQVDN